LRTEDPQSSAGASAGKSPAATAFARLQAGAGALAALYLVYVLYVHGWSFLYTHRMLFPPDQVRPDLDLGTLSLASGALLHILLALLVAVLIPALLLRRRWAWAATLGLLFAQAVSLAVRVVWWVYVLAAPESLRGGPLAWYALPGFRTFVLAALPGRLAETLLLLAPAVLLFGARERYGVGAREGWRTLLREGWWTMTVFLSLTFAQFALLFTQW
jgi:hypothetical protein